MWVAFANAKATHIFSAKILAYMPYYVMKIFNDALNNDINSFEQMGLDVGSNYVFKVMTVNDEA